MKNNLFSSKSARSLFMYSVGLVLATSQAAVAAGNVEGWSASQTCRLVGPQKLELCENAARLTNPTGRIYVIREPFKEVLAISPATKRYTKISAGDFRCPFERSATMLSGSFYSDIPLSIHGKGSYCGVDVVEYQSLPQYTKLQTEKFRRHELQSRVPASAVIKTAALAKASPINRFIANFYGIPPLNGIPLFMSFYDMDHDLKLHLTTGKLTHAKFKKSDFAPPADYKEVGSVDQVFASDNDREAIELLMPGSH